MRLIPVPADADVDNQRDCKRSDDVQAPDAVAMARVGRVVLRAHVDPDLFDVFVRRKV